ncbi:MAG: hypothetical protein K2M95_00245, partial [Clostridiales bacterium]|nr:hypothetical protein [Clostridiales bacterium]
MKNQDGDTPIAKIADDTYTTYYDKTSSNNSKETAQETATRSTENREVKFTVTVLDKLTNEPIPNAIVRLNGVPRFTTKDGTVKVTLVEDVYELFIEKIGSNDKELYNPHIEFLYTEDMAAEENKTVYLKRPSDDIEITSVLFTYQMTQFNLLSQPCYVLENELETYNQIEIRSNVQAEGYMLLIDGKISYYSPINTIPFIDFEGLSGSAFAVQIFYNGIFSKEYPLLLEVQKLETEQLRQIVKSELMAQEMQQRESSSDDVLTVGNEQAGTGEMVKVNTGTEKFINAILDLIFMEDRKFSFDIGPAQIQIQFVFKPVKGTIKFALGFTWSFDIKEFYELHREFKEYQQHTIDKKKKYGAWKEQKMREKEKQITEAQEKIKDYNEKLAEYSKTEAEYKDKMEGLKDAKQYEIDRYRELNRQISDGEFLGDYEAQFKELKDEYDVLNSMEQEYKDQYEDALNKINFNK